MSFLLFIAIAFAQEDEPPAHGETVGEPVGSPVGQPVGTPVGQPVGAPVNLIRVQGERLVPLDAELGPPDLDAIIRAAFEEICNKRNGDYLDTLIGAPLRRHQNGVLLEEVELQRGLAHLYATFPVIDVEIETLLVDEDKVAAQSRWTVQTTADGDSIEFAVALVARFEGEQVVESWETWNTSVVEALVSPPDPTPSAPSKRWWQK